MINKSTNSRSIYKNKFINILAILCIIIITIGVILCIKVSKTNYIGNLLLESYNIKFSTVISVSIILLASYICDKICKINKLEQLYIIKKFIFSILVAICVVSNIMFTLL